MELMSVHCGCSAEWDASLKEYMFMLSATASNADDGYKGS